ncbi:SDR family NAD(P)-dependent oxidoreductase, partial [Flavobacterium filum]|uniref:SDR family NAD(P)-dependent oxidoreductase n=1 Tax=Flavobacterium filum TaxID=370974 RepID=UPI0023F02F21
MSSKNILITGASTGFGKLTSQTLAKQGHMVIATMRDTNGKNAQQAQQLELWAKEHNLKLGVLELDVTSDESVNSAKEKALQLTNDKIDVVINNAGVFGGGLVENFELADYKHLYEVNVFGSVRVTNAFLPTLRRQG